MSASGPETDAANAVAQRPLRAKSTSKRRWASRLGRGFEQQLLSIAKCGLHSLRRDFLMLAGAAAAAGSVSDLNRLITVYRSRLTNAAQLVASS
jgi:hypothetical protein